MGMGGVGLPLGGGIGGILLLLAIAWITGTNPLDLISGGNIPVSQEQPVGTTGVRENDPQAKFISVVLADTEDTWQEVFRMRGQQYRAPVLVLFDGATQSGCGLGRAEVWRVLVNQSINPRILCKTFCWPCI